MKRLGAEEKLGREGAQQVEKGPERGRKREEA